MLRRLKERVLIRTCHLEYRDEDTVEYKMDEKGHLVVSVATPAAKPGEKPSSVTTFGFAPPDPFEWPPK